MPNHISSIKTSDLGCTELEFHLNQGGHSTCKTQTANHGFSSFRKDVDCDFPVRALGPI